MERHIFSVTEVNELVKLLLDNEPMLSGICGARSPTIRCTPRGTTIFL